MSKGSLFSRLGAFGRSIIDQVIATGRSIGDAVNTAIDLAPDISIEDVAGDWAATEQADFWQSAVEGLDDDDEIPTHYMQPTDIPFYRKYAYEVEITGTAAVGRLGPGGVDISGQPVTERYLLPVSRKLSIGEIKAMAARRIGKDGDSEKIDIEDITVTEAYYRDEETFLEGMVWE